MNPSPDAGGLTPEELALLASYQDGSLSSEEIQAVRELLARSEAARAVLSETSAMLGGGPESEDGAVPRSESPPSTAQDGGVATPAGGSDPPRPNPRMGWRSFLPLAAAGLAVIFLLWPGGESLSLTSWSADLAGRGGSEPFPFPALGSAAQDDVAETAGVRWVDLRIAAAAGRKG